MSPPLIVVLLLFLTLAAGPSAANAGDPEAGRRKAQPCAACHGPDGNSQIPTVPSLAGQRAIYLHWQLLLYRDQRRKDAQMAPLAANLSEADMADLAEYYAGQRRVTLPAAAANPETIAAGRQLAERHHCVSCHNPQGAGQHYPPRLDALHYDYLIAQLRAFRSQTRGELDGTMTTAARPLAEEDIDAIARFLTTLPSTP